MKKFYLALSILTLFLFIEESFARKSERSSSSKSASARSSSSRSSSARSSSSVSSVGSSSTSAPSNSFASCMDNICMSEFSEEKGRCRCSMQLPKIEKILRDIDEIQNDADKMNKELEALMNVSNTSSVNSALGNVYENINSIEKKSKNLASQRLDGTTLVMEGQPLYEEALNQCSNFTSSKSETDVEKMKQEYNVSIEGDCAAYTTILKEKADSAASLLTQSQKNREMYEEQEYKSRNQLDTDACFVEYEACIKNQCGEELTSCIEPVRFEASLKKCEATNYGKCEDNKAVVLLDIRKMMARAIKKHNVRQSCASAMGHIINGQCLFKVLYVAERCTIASKCGESEEKIFNPGSSFKCDDAKGPFKEIVVGCKESCYLIGPNRNERYLGTNKGSASSGGKKGLKGLFSKIGTGLASTFCQNPDTVNIPVPSGWGHDGYPTDPELKKAF